MDPKLLKSIAEQLAQFSSEDYTDDEIDESLFDTYPELHSKENYDKHGDYIRGSTYKNFIQEMADYKMPRGEKRYFLNLAHNFLDTATFGLGKKVAALTASVIHDKDYDYVYDSLTEEENTFTDHRPVDAMGSRMAGAFGVGPSIVAAKGYNLLSKFPYLGRALNPKVGQLKRNIARETAKSVPVGVGESVLYTAGTSGSVDEFTDRVGPEAIATGVGSAGMTPLAMGLGKVAGTAARIASDKFKGKKLPKGVKRADDDMALEIMSKAREDGYSDSQIKAEIERIRKIDPDLAKRLVQMDVAGDPFVGTTMGAMATPGGGQAIGVENITPFFQRQVERLQKFSARTLLKKDSVSEFRADVKARRIKAGKLYDDLWTFEQGVFKKGKFVKNEIKRNEVSLDGKTTVKFDEGPEQISLAEILDPNKPTVRKAMAAAQELADEAGVILQPPGSTHFDAEHLHFIKMGYDQVLGTYGEQGLSAVMRMEANKNSKRLKSLMDDHIPGYKKARNAYAMPSAENRAFTEGYQALKNSIDPEKIPDMVEVKFKDLSAHEKEAYKAGAANYMEQFIEQGMDPLSVTNKARKASQFSLIKKIRGIWGDATANKYRDYMEEHAKMLLRRADVSPRSGSLTHSRGEATKQFAFDEPAGAPVPLSASEAVRQGVNTRPNPQANQDLSRGAAEAASKRLTLPGPDQIMKNQADMAAWQKLQRLKEAAQAARRGAVPSLINPGAQDVSNQYNR